MKKGILLLMVIILLLGVSIGIGYYVYQMNNVPKSQSLEDGKTLAGEQITDECTDFSEAYSKGFIHLDTINANYEEKRITPNTTIKTKEIYTKCGHTVENIIETSQNLVNKNKEELVSQYIGWDIDHFSSKEVILSRKLNKMCPEHYILREEKEYIVIYNIDEEGKEHLVEKTGISTKYLPETDRLSLKNGIKAIGKEGLNSTIEDFE